MNDKEHVLSRKECSIMRGFAILAIVVNNFGTWLNGVIGDNEFGFDYGQVEAFLTSLKHPTDVFLLNLIAFYSPFGVMLFIFLSGYGLTLKYEGGNDLSTRTFISDHYKKLFVMQLKGIALFLTILLVFDPDRLVYFRYLAGQLLMVANLNPINPKLIPGPYWFFGMIMEVYLIYRFMFYRRPMWMILILIFFTLIVMACVEPNGKLMYYLRYNLFMAILPFGLGVLVARYGKTISLILRSNTKCLIAMSTFFFLLTASKFNFYSWLVMPLFIVGFSIPFAKLLSKTFFSEVFSWLGGLSGVIFLIHPIFREVLITRTNLSGNYYGMILVYVFMTLSLSLILRPLFVKK